MKYALCAAALLLVGQASAQENKPAPAPANPAAAEKKWAGEVVRFPAGDIASQSYLALPDTPGPHPGILIAHEWWGHNDFVRMRADMLAKLGYAALAMDLYGEGQRAHDPKAAGFLDLKLQGNSRVTNARFIAAMKFLAKRPEVDGERIAAIGYGSGGDVCLQMARNGIKGLDGVVAFHPFFKVGPSNPPIRKATAKVMVCDAREDPYVYLQGNKKLEAFQKVMAAVHTDLTVVPFKDAMQSFTVPNANVIGKKFRIPHVYNAEADAAAWKLLESFLVDLWQPADQDQDQDQDQAE